MKSFVCPQCKLNPKFYQGCRNCGSSRVSKSRLIHHFACAHVDEVANFETDDVIKCPKCLRKNLIGGTDFEYLDGPVRCEDCGWHDLSYELTGYCGRCKIRFPIHCCSEEEDVERVDALVNQ